MPQKKSKRRAEIGERPFRACESVAATERRLQKDSNEASTDDGRARFRTILRLRRTKEKRGGNEGRWDG